MRARLSRAEVFDAEDARIGAVGVRLSRCCWVVTQVLGGDARAAKLVLDERGGHLFGRSGTGIASALHVTDSLAIVRGDIRANVPLFSSGFQ